jgi:hypothetical protein
LATFNDGETVVDYVLHLQGMAATLATLGEVVEEAKIMEKIVRSVLSQFRQIILTITTLLDVLTLSVVDLTGRLKAGEDTFDEPLMSLQHDEKHLNEEWDTRRKKHEEEEERAHVEQEDNEATLLHVKASPVLASTLPAPPPYCRRGWACRSS